MSQNILTRDIALAALIGAHDGIQQALGPVQISDFLKSRGIVFTVGAHEMPLGAVGFFMFAYNIVGENLSTLSARRELFLASPEMTAKASQLPYPVTPTRFVRALHLELVDSLGHAHVPERRYMPR